MIKIAVDGMGGDNAPKEMIEGVFLALNQFVDIEVTLFGHQELMKPYLKEHPRLKIVHTDRYLDMGEKDPIGQYRHNPEASMFKALKSVADGVSDAVVSAGPTQALIVGGHFIVKRMPPMKKVAIAPFIPSADGNPRILLDAGGNTDAKPEHFLEFALYASTVLKALYGIENPKVGLINIGTEPGKGRDIDKEAYKLLENHPHIHFIGNVEPKEVLETEANVLVSDGFTANIVLKTMEGTAKTLGKLLKREIKASFFAKLAAGLFLRKPLKAFKKALDPNEVGGAMILGLKGVVVKAHGSSNAYAFSNAIKQARAMAGANVVGKVSALLGSETPDA